VRDGRNVQGDIAAAQRLRLTSRTSWPSKAHWWMRRCRRSGA